MTEGLASPRTVSPFRRDRVVPCLADDEALSIEPCASTRGCAATWDRDDRSRSTRPCTCRSATVAARLPADRGHRGRRRGAGGVRPGRLTAAEHLAAAIEPEGRRTRPPERRDRRGRARRMTAAYRLHQAGIRPLVFEARDRVGGRCWSARDWVGGQVGRARRRVRRYAARAHAGARRGARARAGRPLVGVGAGFHVADLCRRRDREGARRVPAHGAGGRRDRRARGGGTPRGGRVASRDRGLRRDDGGRVVRGCCRGPIDGPLSPVDPATRGLVRTRPPEQAPAT